MLHYVAVPDPKFTVGVPCSYDAIFSSTSIGILTHPADQTEIYGQFRSCMAWPGCLFGVKPGKMATLGLKCSQLPLALPQTDARIVISVENWV
jgi:hypothetical protein